MHYFKRVEERAKATRKALKKCKTAQQQEKLGIWKAAVNVYGACTGCRNPDDGILEPECRRCKYNEYN